MELNTNNENSKFWLAKISISIHIYKKNPLNIKEYKTEISRPAKVVVKYK